MTARSATTTLVFALSWVISFACMADGLPVAKTTTQIGHLSCAGATLTATTVWLDVEDHDRQPLRQSIVLADPNGHDTASLTSDGRFLRQPFVHHRAVLDAAVTGWACLATKGGKAYVYLLYTCTESPSRPACAGDQREWARLFDAHGKPLNAGYPHTGPRTPTLMKRLGLGHYLSDGVALQDMDR